MKKQISIIFTVILIFILAAIIPSCSKPPRYYIALGDSVSAGYGLKQEESHPAIFFDLLKNDGYVDNYANMAVSGYTTTMLLEYLNNLSSDELGILKNARVITLNIGGNNIAKPFLNYVSDNNLTSVDDNLRARIESVVLRSLNIIYGTSLRGGSIIDSSFGRAIINDVITTVGRIITRFGNEGLASNLLELSLILRGSLSPQLQDELEKGVQAFIDEFKEIIAWLKRNAPKATIIVNTIYNPIPQEVLGDSFGISVVTNNLIESMNNVIIQESKSSGFLVTDTYKYLSYQLDMMFFNLNPYAGNLSLDLIHPNVEGQQLIAKLNYETFLSGK